MATLKDYRQRLLYKLQDHLFWPSVSTTTDAGGSTSEIKDTANLKDAGTDPDPTLYTDMWALLLAPDGYPTQTLNEARQVKSRDATAGTITMKSAFGGTPASGKPYELHKYLHPDALLRLMNEIMRMLRYETTVPLTLVADGDMESTAIWTLGASLLTNEKVTAKARTGIRTTHIVTNGANGYCKSAAIAVSPTRDYTLAAQGLRILGTAKLVLWDLTNAAEIESWSWGDPRWVMVQDQIPMPVTCKSVEIRLQGVESGAESYWDNVTFLPSFDEQFELPTYITRRDHVKGVYYLTEGDEVATNVYLMDREPPCPWSGYSVEVNEFAAVPAMFRLSPGPNGTAPFLRVLRDCPELSADTDLVMCDLDTAVAGAAWKLAQRKGLPEEKTFADEFSARRRAHRPRPAIEWRSAYDPVC